MATKEREAQATLEKVYANTKILAGLDGMLKEQTRTLVKAVFEASEVHSPTSFVLLPVKAAEAALPQASSPLASSSCTGEVLRRALVAEKAMYDAARRRAYGGGWWQSLVSRAQSRWVTAQEVDVLRVSRT